MQNEELEIIRMSEIQMRKVEWLWYPYIPFGKLTIIQGDPGEGKTNFALRLAAACSTGTAMPGMESLSPFNVIYQSAEDGLEDTIKPRLTEAGADQERVINIREDKKSLHLLDSRIEKAILQCDETNVNLILCSFQRLIDGYGLNEACARFLLPYYLWRTRHKIESG